MKKYKYYQNAQAFNSGWVTQLVPLAYTEVVPGDSISGTYQVKAKSATTLTLVDNRAYCDLAAFFVPYRLLWDGFPDFITKGTGTVPTVNNLFKTCFENYYTKNNETELVPWQRRAYNLIYNKYYKLADVADVSLDNNTIAYASYRPTTFHQSIPEGTLTDTTIDTSQPTITADYLRERMAIDEWDKYKAYYGDRYIDHLRALGVEASWSILDEPELRARKSALMDYHAVDTTSEGTGTFVGQVAGYWGKDMEIRLKKTFCPEHGLIVLMGNFKIEQVSTFQSSYISSLDQQEQFWTPEYDVKKEMEYPEQLWRGQLPGASDTVTMPNFEHLRKAQNLIATEATAGTASGNYYVTGANALSAYKNTTPGWWGSLFRGDIGYVPDSQTNAQIAFATTLRLDKRSAVSPIMARPIR